MPVVKVESAKRMASIPDDVDPDQMAMPNIPSRAFAD
jgi:hypothetical protein